MDPNATLEDIRSALILGHDDTAAELASELADWILRGGFSPSDPGWRSIVAETGILPPSTEL